MALMIVRLQRLFANNLMKGPISTLTHETLNFYDITFDVIKRGPLLLIIIGLLFACFCFVVEFIVFYLN